MKLEDLKNCIESELEDIYVLNQSLTPKLGALEDIQHLKRLINMSECSKGLRIKVIRFREGMSYESLAKSSPLGKFSADKLRLLNGHYPNLTPEIGDLIKIVQ